MGAGSSCGCCCPTEPQAAGREQLLTSGDRDALRTPPGSRRSSQPLGKAGLRIDASLTVAREKAGLAETPIGKAADEYRYYCPICMMFFKNILELPCCQHSTCSFCFSEYLQRQQASPAASAGAGVGALDFSAGGKRAPGAPPQLPAGCACPQCAVVAKRARELKQLEGLDEAKCSYLDSPSTIDAAALPAAPLVARPAATALTAALTEALSVEPTVGLPAVRSVADRGTDLGAGRGTALGRAPSGGGEEECPRRRPRAGLSPHA